MISQTSYADLPELAGYLRSVLADGHQITGDYWEVKDNWYDPEVSNANFIVLVPSPPGVKRYPTVASVRASFGQPRRRKLFHDAFGNE